MFCLACPFVDAQEYTVRSAGQGKAENYLVSVTVSSKKKPKAAEDLVKEYAVRGVMFRGLMAADGYGEQKPLIKDPNIEQTRPTSSRLSSQKGLTSGMPRSWLLLCP